LAKPSPKELIKRRTHSPEFKARVAMEAISGRKTSQEIAADHAIHPIQEIAADHAIHPIQVSQ
jgi:transposase-like protein